MRSWIRTGAASCSNRIPAIFKTAIVAHRFCEVSRRIFPFIQRVFADSGYAGEKVTTATLIAVEIVRKNPDQVGFAVNPRRWVVERFFAWIGRDRRLAKDFEATIDSARALLYAASVMLLVRRIAGLYDFRNQVSRPVAYRRPHGVARLCNPATLIFVRSITTPMRHDDPPSLAICPVRR